MAATVKVRNKGPFAREIRPGGTTGERLAVVEVGGVVEVSAALGASLAEQVDVWELVTSSSDKPAKAEKTEG